MQVSQATWRTSSPAAEGLSAMAASGPQWVLAFGNEDLLRSAQPELSKVFVHSDVEQIIAVAEANNLAKLGGHPNIVNIYEVYEAEQCLILVLEYMAGGELYEQISQRKRLTEAEVR